MLRIFIPDYALATICLNEQGLDPKDQSVWFQIFKKQNQIFCSIKDNADLYNPESPLFIFSQSYNVEILDDTEYIDSITVNPENVLEEPSPAFLLDIDNNTAKKIQKKYGVICQSINDLDGSILTIEPMSLSPAKGEKGYSWERLLTTFGGIPHNAILIVDRYLFADDSETNNTALKSIFECLDILLPKSFNTEFPISIIIDPDTLRNGLDFAKLSNRLNKMKGKLNRNFPIKIELVGISGTERNQHEKTHNRRIATNYLIMSAEHHMCAFSGDLSICAQKVDAKTLYSEGLLNLADSPNKAHTMLLKDISDIRDFWEQMNFLAYKISVNGQVKEKTVKDWTNRLLNNLDE